MMNLHMIVLWLWTHYELCDKLYEEDFDHELADKGLWDSYTKRNADKEEKAEPKAQTSTNVINKNKIVVRNYTIWLFNVES